MDAASSRDPALTRRALLERAAAGLVVLTLADGLTPAQARAANAPLTYLSASQGAALAALGDALLPDAAQAGIAHYVDDQLGRDIPLLILKYLDYPGSYRDFYRGGLDALDSASRAQTGKPFARSASEQQRALVRTMMQHDPKDWSGPPASLFYFVTRSDAVDVVYGTVEGFQKLGIPYLPHITPPERW